jgi:hypothetical protein
LVEILCYEPEGHGFKSDEVNFFFLGLSFKPQYGLGVDPASNRNEYKEFFWGSAHKADDLAAICKLIV